MIPKKKQIKHIVFLTLINLYIMESKDRIDPDDWYDMGFPYS